MLVFVLLACVFAGHAVFKLIKSHRGFYLLCDEQTRVIQVLASSLESVSAFSGAAAPSMTQQTTWRLAAMLALYCTSSLATAAGLCTPAEYTVFSCDTKTKTYAVCESKVLSANEGYLQYRVGRRGRVEFTFPPKRVSPKGIFYLTSLPRGAMLSFQNGEFSYDLVEPLEDYPSIWVSKGGGDAAHSVKCLHFMEHDSLTLPALQAKYKAVGIYE